MSSGFSKNTYFSVKIVLRLSWCIWLARVTLPCVGGSASSGKRTDDRQVTPTEMRHEAYTKCRLSRTL